MKKMFIFFLGIITTQIIFSQNQINLSNQKKEEIRTGILNGPSSIPVCYLMKNPEIENATITFQKYNTPQNLLPKLIKNEIDIAFLPLNVAVKTFNTSNHSIKILCVTGNGNIFLITTDQTVNKITDLHDKKVTVAGQGATPDYLFQYILQENEISINKKEIILDYSIPNAQIPALLIAGKIEYAVVPEPFVTIAKTKSKNVRIAVDFQEEYKFFSKNQQTYPLTVLVSRKDFIQKNPELIEQFLKEYQKSYEWTIQNPSAAGKLCEELDFGLNAKIVEKSIPNANYTFVKAQESKEQIQEFLQILMKLDTKAIGDKLPEEDFYYAP